MTDSVAIAVVGLLGVLVGAIIQAVLTRINQKDDFIRQKKTEAYLLFFSGVAELAHAEDREKETTALAKIAQARGQCALYAGDEVLERMTDAWRKGPISQDDLPIHAAMIRAMRKDTLGAKSETTDAVLFETVYGAGGEPK